MRQTIISTIATAISTIEAVKTVTDWYTDQITDTMLPLVNIKDTKEDITKEGGYNHHQLQVEIDIYDKRNSSDVRDLITDVIKVTNSSILGIVTDVNIEGCELTREAEANSVYIATLHFVVSYSTNPETMEVVQC